MSAVVCFRSCLDFCETHAGYSDETLLWRGGEPGAFYDDLWRFSTSTREWVRVNDTGRDGTRPSARGYHAMASLGMDLWVHGGQTQKDPDELYSDELWLFSTLNGEWFRVDDTGPDGIRPSSRCRHAMAPLGVDLWVHGGSTYSGEGGSRMLKTRIATAAAALRQRVCHFAHCCMCLQLVLQGF